MCHYRCLTLYPITGQNKDTWILKAVVALNYGSVVDKSLVWVVGIEPLVIGAIFEIVLRKCGNGEGRRANSSRDFRPRSHLQIARDARHGPSSE